MNTASRMESHGAVKRVHVSTATFDLIKNQHHDNLKFEDRGLVEIKVITEYNLRKTVLFESVFGLLLRCFYHQTGQRKTTNLLVTEWR